MAARFILLFLLLGLNLQAQKKPVRVPRNNAEKIVQRLSSRGLRALADRQLYFLALYHAGKLEPALKYYRTLDPRILGLSTKLVQVHCLMGLGRYDQALPALHKLDDRTKPDLRVDYLRARCWVHLKRYKQARVLLALILRIRPNHAGAHYYYALTCAPAGEWRKAIKHCRQVLLLEGRDSTLARNAAGIMLAAMLKQDQLKKTKTRK